MTRYHVSGETLHPACSLIHSSYSFVDVDVVTDGGMVKMEQDYFWKVEMMDDDEQSVISTGSFPFQSNVVLQCYCNV